MTVTLATIAARLGVVERRQHVASQARARVLVVAPEVAADPGRLAEAEAEHRRATGYRGRLPVLAVVMVELSAEDWEARFVPAAWSSPSLPIEAAPDGAAAPVPGTVLPSLEPDLLRPPLEPGAVPPDPVSGVPESPAPLAEPEPLPLWRSFPVGRSIGGGIGGLILPGGGFRL